MAQVQDHTTVIDGKTYTAKTFPALEGLVILPKLIALLGEDIANLVFATSEGQLDQLMNNPAVLTKMIVSIAEKAAQTDGLLVLHDLMKYVNCDQVKVGDAVVSASVYTKFNDHFAGDYLHMFKVVSWVARISFAKP